MFVNNYECVKYKYKNNFRKVLEIVFNICLIYFKFKNNILLVDVEIKCVSGCFLR